MRHLAPALILLAASSAPAQLWHLENFEGTNGAAWTFDAPGEGPSPTGGFSYCCAYLRSGVMSTALPMVRTGAAGTPFTGDYRAAGITQVSAALILHRVDTVPPGGVSPFVLLTSFNGTPGDPSDDWGAFHQGTAYFAGPTWLFFTFGVPAVQTSLPWAWIPVRLGPNAPLNPDWNVLVQAVDRLAFTLARPGAANPTREWDVGVDYIVITNHRNCYPNCDDSTAAPCLNVLDFVCFLNQFAAGAPYANCDGSTNVPTHTVQDSGCYLMSYAAGCSGC